ncbi:hypothetical protein HK096_011266, partial [Nowakowskiella sp. JEL0078]
MSDKGKTKGQKLLKNRTHIESLYAMFRVYSEFKNSQHFGRQIRINQDGKLEADDENGSVTVADFLKL